MPRFFFHWPHSFEKLTNRPFKVSVYVCLHIKRVCICVFCLHFASLAHLHRTKYPHLLEEKKQKTNKITFRKKTKYAGVLAYSVY